MTTQTEATAAPVPYHWIATIQNGSGRIETHDGPASAIPGIHTHTSTYNAVIANLKEMHGPNFGLLFFSLTPDQL